MIQDAQNLFEDAAAFTATRISTNVIQRNATDNATINVAGGKYPPRLVVTVTTAFVNPGTSELVLTLESDSTADLATSPTVHLTTANLAASMTSTGVILDVPFPTDDYEAFIGLRLTNAGANWTSGNLSAAIVIDSDDQRKYANRSEITPVT